MPPLHGGLGVTFPAETRLPAAEKELKNALQLDRNNLAYWKTTQLRVLLGGNYRPPCPHSDVIAKAERPRRAMVYSRTLFTISLMRFNLLSMRIESFWNSTRTKNPNQVWQANQRIHCFLRKGLRTRSRAGNPGPGISAFAPVIFLLVCSSLFAADKIKELQDHFDRDPHAATRIKTLDKLGLARV